MGRLDITMPKDRVLWSIPVGLRDVPPEGLHVALSADQTARAEVARLLGTLEVPRLDLEFTLRRTAGDGLRVTGRVSATVAQTCVVTLDPMSSDLVEDVDLVFLADGETLPESAESDVAFDADDPPEMLPPGGIDLAMIAIEFLQLGLDPYPRKPDAAFEAREILDAQRGQNGPFAALAALRKTDAQS